MCTDRSRPPRRAGGWRVCWILALVLLAWRPAQAQTVAFSSTSANTGRIGSGWDHNVPAGGQGRYLVIGVSVDWSADTPTVMSASYAEVALARLASADLPGTAHVEIWGLANPPEGTNLAEVRLTANAGFTAGAASFTGVDPSRITGPFPFAVGIGSPARLDVASVAGEVVFTVFAAGADLVSLDAQAPHQRHWFLNRGAGGSGPGGSPQVRWDHAPAQTSWILAGFALRPVVDGSDGGAGGDGSAAPDAGDPPDSTAAPDSSGARDSAATEGGGGSDGSAPGPDASAADAAATDGPAPAPDAAARDGGTSAGDVALSLRDIDVRVGCACRLSAGGGSGAPVLLVLLGVLAAVGWRRRG